MAKSLPEVLLPGFGLGEDELVVDGTETPVTASPVTSTVSTVNLNLGDAPVAQATPAATAAGTTDNDDILKMADDIFNS